MKIAMKYQGNIIAMKYPRHNYENCNDMSRHKYENCNDISRQYYENCNEISQAQI